MDIIAGAIVSKYFGWILAIIIFLAPIWLKKYKAASQIQVIVTTAGMFGTFLGIVAGISLLELGINELNLSITKLLGGLTTAFLTSIAGLLASLVIQMVPHGFPYYLSREEEGSGSQEVSMSDVLVELKLLNKNIAGEGDMSLTTQIIKMRSDNNDNHKELKKSFDEFAKQMAENNIKSLVEAVNKVMEDFNTKINDQLGKSFKELSDSVKNLVEWQKDYKSLIESSTETLKVAQKSLKNSSESLSNTSDKVSQIAENNKKIEELNQEFKSVVEKLNQMLGSTIAFSVGIKSLSEELSGSGENIRKEVKDIVEGSIKEMNSMTEAYMRDIQNKNSDVLKNFEEMNRKTLSAFGGHLASISEKLVEDFREVQKALEIKKKNR